MFAAFEISRSRLSLRPESGELSYSETDTADWTVLKAGSGEREDLVSANFS